MEEGWLVSCFSVVAWEEGAREREAKKRVSIDGSRRSPLAAARTGFPPDSRPPIAPSQRQRPVQIAIFSNPALKRDYNFRKPARKKETFLPLERSKKQRPSSAAHPLFPFPPFPFLPQHHSYQASRDDLAVFAALASAPDAKSYPAAARWFSHVKALLGASFPGAGKGVSVAGGAGAAAAGGAAAAAAPAAAAKAAASSDSDSDDSDDELDLFGEMTPEELAAAEAKKKVIEEAKRRGAEKAKLTKSMIVLDVKPWDDETDLALMEAEVSRFVFFWGGGEERAKERKARKKDEKLT